MQYNTNFTIFLKIFSENSKEKLRLHPFFTKSSGPKIITELKWKCDVCQRRFYAEKNFKAHTSTCRRRIEEENNDNENNDEDIPNMDDVNNDENIPNMVDGNENLDTPVRTTTSEGGRNFILRWTPSLCLTN